MRETFAEESNTAQLNEEERDLGFGSVVAARQGRLLNRDGSFNAERTGINPLSSLYLYHWLLNLSWRQFLGLSAILYMALNLVFAVAFWFSGDILHQLFKRGGSGNWVIQWYDADGRRQTTRPLVVSRQSTRRT